VGPMEHLILPKSLGGMGFKDLRLFNQALPLLAPQAWRLIAFPDSLCARVLKAKYFPQGNLLDTVIASDASPTWKAIEHGLTLLKKGVVWRIGDGKTVRIWRDNWFPRPCNLKPIWKLRACRIRRVEHLIDQVTRAWDETILRRYFYQCDVEEVLKIKLPALETEDWIAWNYEKSRLFTVRSAYRLAMRDVHEMGAVGSSSSRDGERLTLRENACLPCVIMFAVRFTSGARQRLSLPCVFQRAHSKHKRTVTRLFAVRFPTGARQTQIFAVRFRRDARQSAFANASPVGMLFLLTDVHLCHASSQDARQRRIVCSAFCLGARQTCIFAVRFGLTHGKVFFKNDFSCLLLIFPSLIHYFVLHISIM
jgi:hypothetical protein